MNIKCPNCGGNLEYDPVNDQMVCVSCGTAFDSMEVVNFEENEPPHFQSEADKRKPPEPKNASGIGRNIAELEYEMEDGEETMECSVYTCTECGAELMVSDVESATFCAYCGQPAIVFSRISKTKKPDFIVPFIIRKERVPQILQENLGKSVAVFKDLKNLKVEDMKGVYIPYWCFDMYYRDRQVWKGRVKSGKSSSEECFFEREAEADFKDIALDASRNFNDNYSRKLEPFDLRTKKPFQIGYLQGFYADCYDVNVKEMQRQAKARAGEEFNEEVKKTIDASLLKLVESDPACRIKSGYYVLLPVWFVIIRGEESVHTLLVNGQTGKVTGFLPYNKKKVTIFTFLVSMISMLFMYPLVNITFDSLRNPKEGDQLGVFLFFMGILLVIFLAIANTAGFIKIYKSETLSSEKKIYRSVKNRQER